MSYKRWCEIVGKEDFTARCIRHDMDIHTIKSDGVEAFAKLEEAPALLLAGLAEIHANASMFGGLDSQGFKIKYAQIERRGKMACKVIFGD